MYILLLWHSNMKKNITNYIIHYNFLYYYIINICVSQYTQTYTV